MKLERRLFDVGVTGCLASDLGDEAAIVCVADWTVEIGETLIRYEGFFVISQ